MKTISKGILVMAVVLAIWNFTNLCTLWLDEAMLALNIVQHGLIRLLLPLDYFQVAPVGYLWMLKGLTHPFDGAIWAFRLPSLAAFALSLYAFRRGMIGLLDIHAPAGSTSLANLLTASLCLSPFLLKYSVEIKQYMFDFAVWSVGFAGIVALQRGSFQPLSSKRHGLLLLISGPIAMAFSNVAVLILFSWGLSWLIGDVKRWRHLFPILSGWAGAFIIFYLLSIHDHPAREFMQEYWSRAGAFMPFDDQIFNWTFSRIFELIQSVIPWSSSVTSMAFAALWTLGLLFTKSRAQTQPLLVFLLLPILMHFVLSGLQMYPMAKRLGLWHIGGMVAMWGLVLGKVGSSHRSLRQTCLFLLAFSLVLQGKNTLKSPPKCLESIENVLEHFEANPGDFNPIYMDLRNWASTKFHLGTHTSFPERNFIVLGDYKSGFPDDLPEVTRSAPDTCWVLVHDYSFSFRNEKNETPAQSALEHWREQGRSVTMVTQEGVIEMWKVVNNP